MIINFIIYDGHLFDRIVSSVAMRNTMTDVRDTAMLRAPAPAVEQHYRKHDDGTDGAGTDGA